MAVPRIAVAPVGVRDYLRQAVRDSGAELVDPVDADGLVWTDVGDPETLSGLLDRYPSIRWVQLPWAGVEPFARAGVFDDAHLWTSGKGAYAEPVAEHALALTLAGLREIKRWARAESWSEDAGISLVRGRVTIFGGGGIAETLLRMLAPFDCQVTVVRRHPEEMAGADSVIGFDRRYEALKGADAVILALALTAETAALVSSVELELMEPHAWLVNVARGELVVTEDLVVALRDDVIGGAALDVTDPEPLPDGHPLWELPNCLVTPHVGNTEDMAQPLLAARIRENIRRFAEGEELLGRVDPALGY